MFEVKVEYNTEMLDMAMCDNEKTFTTNFSLGNFKV